MKMKDFSDDKTARKPAPFAGSAITAPVAADF